MRIRTAYYSDVLRDEPAEIIGVKWVYPLAVPGDVTEERKLCFTVRFMNGDEQHVPIEDITLGRAHTLRHGLVGQVPMVPR